MDFDNKVTEISRGSHVYCAHTVSATIIGKTSEGWHLPTDNIHEI